MDLCLRKYKYILIFIAFKIAPAVLNIDKPIETVEGQNVYLNCTILPNPKDINLFFNSDQRICSWSLTKFQAEEGFKELCTKFQNGIVTLSNVKKENTGTYTCVEVGSNDIRKFNLNVFENQVSKLSENAIIYKRENNIFSCSGETKQPLLLKWMKGKNGIKKVPVTSKFEDVLRFMPSDDELDITITCQLETKESGNLRGIASTSAKVYSFVSLTTLERLSINIPCYLNRSTYRGDSTWSLSDGKSLERTNTTDNSVTGILRLSFLTRKDSRSYLCLSKGGNIFANLTVHENHIRLQGEKIQIEGQPYSMTCSCTAKAVINLYLFKDENLIVNKTLNLTSHEGIFNFTWEITTSNKDHFILLKCQARIGDEVIGQEELHITVYYSPRIISSPNIILHFEQPNFNIYFFANPFINGTAVWSRNGADIPSIIKNLNKTFYCSEVSTGNVSASVEGVYYYNISNNIGTKKGSVNVRLNEFTESNVNSLTNFMKQWNFITIPLIVILAIAFIISVTCGGKRYLLYYEVNKKWPNVQYTVKQVYVKPSPHDLYLTPLPSTSTYEMVRTYQKRSDRRSWEEDKMIAAMHAVGQENTACNKAAATYGLPEATLRCYLKKDNKEIELMETTDTVKSGNDYSNCPNVDWTIPEGMGIKLNKRLGEGCFGSVYQARVKIPGMQKTVAAVKFIKGGQSASIFQTFKEEIRIHRELPHHQNVVKYMGHFYKKGCLGMVMEYISGGNLKDYLSDFQNRPFWRQSKNIIMSSNQLLLYGYQIAQGMAHLAKNGVIHRDLAARNILLGYNVCKISDFGLARDVTGIDSEVYTMHQQCKVPVRWLALECLLYNRYTTKSDVWSYGITLWEIVTLGLPPYPDMESATEVVNKLLEGYRMKPAHCSIEIYNIMLRCWAENPEDRPEFEQITTWIDQLLNQNSTYINFSENLKTYENVNPKIFREAFCLGEL